MTATYNTGTAQATDSSSNTYALTIPAGVAAGDLMIYVVHGGWNTAGGSLTVASTGTTLTQLGSTQSYTPGDTWHYQVYYATASGTDAGKVITASWTGTGTWTAAFVSYTGGTGIDVYGHSTITSGTSWTDPSETTGAFGDWAIQICAGDRAGNDTITPPSGTSRVSASNPSGAYINVIDSGGSVGSSGTAIGGATWSSTASEQYMFVTTIGLGAGPAPGTGAHPWQFPVGAPSGGDDTTAINNAIAGAAAWAQANNYYAEVLFNPAVYTVSGSLSHAQSGNAQIPLPLVPISGNPSLTLALIGTQNNAGLPMFAANSDTPTAETCGTVIKSTLTSQSYSGTYGSPSVIGSATPEQGYTGSFTDDWNDLFVVIDGLTVMAPIAPTLNAVDLRSCVKAEIKWLACLADGTLADIAAGANPATAGNAGLVTPQNGNNAHTVIGAYACAGFGIGVQLYECATFQHIACVLCGTGIYTSNSSAGHGFSGTYYTAQANNTHLFVATGSNTTGLMPINILTMECEQISQWASGHHIDDADNLAGGRIAIQVDYGSTFDPSSLSVNGGANLEIIYDGSARGSVLAPTVPATGVALLNPFWRHATVYIAGAMTGVVEIDGAPTTMSDPWTGRVPAGKTIALTYTTAPSWYWIVD